MLDAAVSNPPTQSELAPTYSELIASGCRNTRQRQLDSRRRSRIVTRVSVRNGESTMARKWVASAIAAALLLTVAGGTRAADAVTVSAIGRTL